MGVARLRVLLLAFVLGCGAPAEPQTAVSRAPIGQNTHGAAKMFGDALGEVSLRAEQRAALEQMAAEAEARYAPSHAARADLMNTFAAMVESGTIDAAALDAKVEVVAASLEQVQTGDRAALMRLHALLDKGQRDEFAEAYTRQFKGKHGFMHDGVIHLKELGAELNLTDEQKTQIKDVLKGSFKEGRHDSGQHFKDFKRRIEALDAFREDDLDLAKAMPPVDVKAAAHTSAQHVGEIAQRLLPILTPEQRKLAAEKLRAMDASLLVH